ncbi:MAG TPA: sigma-54 dependent transcriptional regulator [Vicinamibacterales bacterium]|nr:sigma-54 dependent transcriptional regulator [Vicinamibacterales bacterium]
MTPAARLAVVDDDEAFTEYLQTLLKSRGYDVEVFHSGEAFIERLEAGPAPQLILLDVMMPGHDGIETLRAIRQAHPSMQVIMLSGRQTPATIVEAVRLGAADYVIKPGDPDGVGEAALESAIRNALERQSLSAEVARLGAQIAEDPEGMQPYWGTGPSMAPVMEMVDRIADSDVTVLLRGESGVGKEVIARELHRRSSRRTKPFVKVNCAALPADLLESELFGHEKGSFTGAGATRIGKFEFAQHGTILLDEISELPAALQAKLLHVLQDDQITKLGSNRAIDVDVRVIAATNQNLEAMMRAGTFREDLYYRIQVIEVRLPPLRERREEILAFVEFFLIKYAAAYRRPPVKPSDALLRQLVDYAWPGNVRELENMMKRFVVLQDENFIHSELSRLTQDQQAAAAPVAPVYAPPVDPVVPPITRRDADGEDVDDDAEVNVGDGVDLQALVKGAVLRLERDAIEQALIRFRWNRRKAASHLRVSYKTLLNKMKECGITDPTGV